MSVLKKVLCFFIWLLLIGLLEGGTPIVITGDDPPPMTYRLIPLRSLSFSTVEKVCRPWLSKKGLLVYEKRRQSVLVYDRPKVIQRIREFIAQTDEAIPNIRIDIDRVGSAGQRTGKFSYHHRRRPRVFTRVIGGRPGTVVVKYPEHSFDIRARRDSSSSLTSSFVVTQSGSPAQLWVGKSEIDPTWRRYQQPERTVTITPHSTTVTTMPQPPVMTNVGVSLQVLPRYLGNGMIEVEVYPEISEIVGKGHKKKVKITELSSKVTVKEGSRISIGGIVKQKRQRYINIFGPDFFKRSDINEVMNIYLTARVIRAGRGGDIHNWIPRGR